jgi:hypothetical protein
MKKIERRAARRRSLLRKSAEERRRREEKVADQLFLVVRLLIGGTILSNAVLKSLPPLEILVGGVVAMVATLCFAIWLLLRR